MNPSITQEISLLRGFLDQTNDLGIVIGSHQSLDTVASALALYLSLSQSGKKVQIISKKEPTVEVSNLVGINKVTENFVGNTNKLVVSLPYIKGEVEKVLFTEFPNSENPTNINFHLTAAEGKSITPFNNSDVKLLWEGGSPSAVITLGVGSVDELMGTVEANSVKMVNIDNFQGNSRFGDIILVDEAFSSLSEIVAKIIKDLNFPIDMDIAQNILDGVLFATRNFTKQNTSPLAFEAASAAMYQGAQRKADEQPSQRKADEQSSQPQQQQGRRDQSFQNSGRQNQGQNQGQNQNREARSQQNNNRPQRVSDADFPAMHMQAPKVSQNTDNRRTNNPTRGAQNVNPQRSEQPFSQNRNMVDEIRNKIRQENRPQQQFQNESMPSQPMQSQSHQSQPMPSPIMEDIEPEIQDAQLVNEPTMSPIEDVMPTEQESFNPATTDEIPDDWLMPKVFKSSKNNN